MSSEKPPQWVPAPSQATSKSAPAAAGLDALRRLEAEVEADWAELQRRGYGHGQLCERLARRDPKEPDGGSWLAAADLAQEAFLARLDGFQRLQHVHFMQRVSGELDRAMGTMTAFYGGRRIRPILRRYRKLKRLADRYRELEHHYGTAQDHQRISVYQRFYAEVVAFSGRIRRLDPTMPRRSPPSMVDRLYTAVRALLWVARRFGGLLRVIVAVARILRIALAKRARRGGTPLTNRLDDLFRAYGELKGYEVEVRGREHLPPPGESCEQTVWLFAPAHRHGVTDNVTFSHLGLSDYLVFNAVDQLPLVPRFLKERAAATPGLIAVGGGRGSSVDRALEALEAGVSRNILIYPEGTVSEGFRGTRPPRRNFGEGLIRRLRELGRGVHLVPVTYLDNARFLDLPPLSDTADDRRRRVVVSPPLDTAVIDALLSVGGGPMINRMARLAWLENLVTDERCLLGQDRVAEVEKRLDLELDGIRYWGSLESVPASDRLETGSGDAIAIREEPFRGKRVRVLEVPETARDEAGRIRLENLRSADSAELLIGIRPPSHIYLSVGRRRFDGDIFRRLSVKERDCVYPGILIRFVGVPVKSLNAIRRRLEEFSGRERRTLTCANSACRLIARAANMKIDDHADLRPFLPSHVLPTRTIRKLIERGVRNHAGERVDYQVYKTDPRALEAILAEMRRAEYRIAADHLAMATLGASRAIATGARKLYARVRAA